MRTVGIGRLARNDDIEAAGEGVLRGRADADIGLDAGDDDALDFLLVQEQREIGGEERAVAALGGDDLARPGRLEPGEERRVGIADEMMARQLAPFVIVEAGIMLLDRMDDDLSRGPRLREKPAQRLDALRPPPDNDWAFLRERRNW